MSRTPKRMALHEQRQHKAQAEQSAADARRPFDKVKDQEERAAALVQQRESELAALDRAEAELIANGGSPNDATDEQRQKRRRTEEDLAVSRRALTAVRQHGEMLRVPADRAAVEAQRVASETAGFVDDVLREEAGATITALIAARAEAVRLEAAARSIAAALAHRKSYRHAEAINVAVNTLGWAEKTPNATPYLQLAERLVSDPDATVSP